MSEFESGKSPHWYVIHTKPKQEDRANVNLNAWGVETFWPRLKERRPNPNPNASKFIYVNKQLFPQYLFARFDASELLHKICFTRGVHSVISFGGGPVPIDDDIIECLRSRIEDNSYMRPTEELKSGDKVVIQNGPLKEIVGVLEHDLKDHERVSILLEAVKFQGRILVEREMIKKRAAHSGE